MNLSSSHDNISCGFMLYPIIPLCPLCLADVMAELVVCHLRLLNISAGPNMQNSGSLQDLPAGFDSTVTSAYILGSARRCSDSPFLMRMSSKCDDWSRQRHQQILSACHIRSCAHLVEVILYNHILVSLPTLILTQIHNVHYIP